jgi:hypothetical protein
MPDDVKKLVLFLIWIYIITRAYYVSITHDEAYSFLLIKTNYIKAMVGTANTHWLNSLGMKLGNIFLGDEPWHLRLFSVLAWPLYGYSAYRLSRSISNTALGTGLFVLLVFNPFLLDFFSLARGYGLTCAFVSASVWKMTDQFNDKNSPSGHWKASLLFAIAALISNYTSLYFLMALSAGIIIFCMSQQNLKVLWQPPYKRWVVLVLCAGVVAVANLLFIKFYTGDLEYGGRGNMVESLVGSLVSASFYFKGNEVISSYVSYAIAVLLVASFIYAAYAYSRRKRMDAYLFLSMIIFFMFLLNGLFHLFLGTPYLYSRTTLMLYPVAITFLFYFFNDVSIRFPTAKLPATILTGVFTIGFIAHFVTCFNTSYCFEWKQQSDSKECLDFLAKEGTGQVLIHEWHFGVYKNYYSIIAPDKYSFQSELVRTADCMEVTEDFSLKAKRSRMLLLLPPFDLQKMQDQGLNFTVLKTFPFTGSVVIKILGGNQ